MTIITRRQALAGLGTLGATGVAGTAVAAPTVPCTPEERFEHHLFEALLALQEIGAYTLDRPPFLIHGKANHGLLCLHSAEGAVS